MSCRAILSLVVLVSALQPDAPAQTSGFTTDNGLLRMIVPTSSWNVESRRSEPSHSELITLKRTGSSLDSALVRIRSTRDAVNLLDTPALAGAAHPETEGWSLEGKLSPSNPGQPFCLVFVRGRGTEREEKNVIFSFGTATGLTEVTIVLYMSRLTKEDRSAIQALLSGFSWQTDR
jgi:hypothetical protein